MGDDRFSPRCSVYKIVNGKQVFLPVKIKELTYLSTEKKADKCSIVLLNDELIYPDDPTFDNGSVLSVSWGYPGNMSIPREVVVEKYTPGYPDFKVECLGKGILLHKIKFANHWENVRRSDVARALAEKWGYGSALQDIEETTEVFSSITQSMQTDASFLTKMAARESKKGNVFTFAVDNTGFHFHRERLGATPVRTFNFIPNSNDPGDLKDFPKFEAVSVQNKPGKVTSTGIDLVNGKKVEGVASNETDPGRSTLGTHVIVFAKKGSHTSEERNAAAETTSATAARTNEEAKTDATASYAKSTGKASKCTLPIIGDPRLFAKDIIRIERIGKKLSGNYIITEASHKFKPGDFSLDLKLRRDALNAGSGAGKGAGGTSGAQSPQAKSDIAAEMASLSEAARRYREAIRDQDPAGVALYQQDAERYIQLEQQLAASNATTAGKPNDSKGSDPYGTLPGGKTEQKIVYGNNGTRKVQFVDPSGKGSTT